jgi:hypothetical protein
MIGAWVIELVDDETQTERGFHAFVQLPAVGDRIAFVNERGTTDILEAVEIEHAPVPLANEGGAPADAEPAATVFVQWLEEVGAA